MKIRVNPLDKIVYKSTGTKDREIANRMLNDLYQKMEREAAGIAIPEKLKTAACQPLSKLVLKHLNTLEASDAYIYQTEGRLKRLCSACEWKTLSDVTSLSFLEWRSSRSDLNAKTKNHYLSTAHNFFSWLVDNEFMETNPLFKVKPLPTRGKNKFKFRALTLEELTSLLASSGRRSLIYHFAVLTGLRHREVSLLQWGDFDFENFALKLRGSTTKNGKSETLPLHPELAKRLADRYAELEPKLSETVFQFMPDNKTVRRDFIKAGIDVQSDRNEKASFHSLRKTFCTMLHLAGVPQRVAQEAMRHSDPKLTNAVYFDSSLAPLSDAINSLPPLSPSPQRPPYAPPKGGFSCQKVAETGKMELGSKRDFKQKTPEKAAFLEEKKWCTREESNLHAVAGTRT